MRAAAGVAACVRWAPRREPSPLRHDGAVAAYTPVSPHHVRCGNIQSLWTDLPYLDILRSYAAALRDNGATRVYVFGSRARGTNRPDSDLDLLIHYDPGAKVPNMFRLMQVEEQISEALGVPVTITTRNALHPLMKDSIERDAVRVL